MRAEARQINEAINRPKQVIGRDVPLDAKLVEQRFLHHRPFTHHRHVLHP